MPFLVLSPNNSVGVNKFTGNREMADMGPGYFWDLMVLHSIIKIWGIHRKEKENREEEEGRLNTIFYKGKEKSGLERKNKKGTER